MVERHYFWVVGLVVSMFAAVACSGSSSDGDTIIVFAASSLTDVFGQIEAEFEANNPGVDVIVSLGGSSSLRNRSVQVHPLTCLLQPTRRSSPP